jgi:NADPH-dependent 2,4-dienoyl-CoA reductase/sulfur reductase-like enzyme
MSSRILSPEGSVGSRAVALAPAPDVLSGLRLVVLDNGKPGAARLMSHAAERIAERTGVELVGVRRKRTAATPCEDELIEAIRQEADLVLTGTAD